MELINAIKNKVSQAQYAREMFMTPELYLTHNEPVKEDVNKNKAIPMQQE